MMCCFLERGMNGNLKFLEDLRRQKGFGLSILSKYVRIIRQPTWEGAWGGGEADDWNKQFERSGRSWQCQAKQLQQSRQTQTAQKRTNILD